MRHLGKAPPTVGLGFAMVALLGGCGTPAMPGLPVPVEPSVGADARTPISEPESQNTPPIEVTASASDTTAGVGDVVYLLARVSGGIPDYIYSWTQTSGPAGATITDASEQVASVTFRTAGTFTFSAFSQDANGQSAESAVTVTVTGTSAPAPASQSPAPAEPPASVPNPTPSPSPPPALTVLLIFADDGQFLGMLSDNPFDPDSIANHFGAYGNPFSSTSIWNDFGTYGSSFSVLSPFNNFTSTPPVIVDGTGLFWGYLTTNRILIPRYDPNDVAILVGRPEEVRVGF